MSGGVRKERSLLRSSRGITILQTLVLTAVTVGVIAVAMALREAVTQKTCAQASAIGGIGAGGGDNCGGDTSTARVMPAAEDKPKTNTTTGGDPAPAGGGDRAPGGEPTDNGGATSGGDDEAPTPTPTYADGNGVIHIPGGPWKGGMRYVPGSDYASPMPGTFPEGTYQRLNVKTGQVEQFTEGLLGYSAPQFDFTAGWLTPGYKNVSQNDAWIVDTSNMPKPDPNQEVWQEWRWSFWATEPGDTPVYQQRHVAGVLEGTGVAPVVGLTGKGLGLVGVEWDWGKRFAYQTSTLADKDTAMAVTIVGLAVDVFTLGGSSVRHAGKLDAVADVALGVGGKVDDAVRGTGPLLTTTRQSDNVYPLLNGETGRVIGEVRGDTPIFRIEPKNATTPMQPHQSPYFEPGRIHAGGPGDALFVADSKQALADLEKLRREQGYFANEELVLRVTTYDDLVKAYPDARIMTDAKMEFGRGIEGARIVVVPERAKPTGPLHFQEFEPGQIGRVVDELPTSRTLRLDPDIKEGLDALGNGERVTIPRGEFDTTGVVEYLQNRGGHTVFVDAAGDLQVVRGTAELPANGKLVLSDKQTFSGKIAAGNLLDASEASGHTIGQHIGLDQAALQARLDAKKKLTVTSSFSNRAEAEAALSSVVDAKAAEFDKWVADGAKGHLTLQAPFTGGTVLPRGGTASTGTHARFVLQSDGQGGFYILTGFPTRPALSAAD
jgi:hypothetical protein